MSTDTVNEKLSLDEVRETAIFIISLEYEYEILNFLARRLNQSKNYGSNYELVCQDIENYITDIPAISRVTITDGVLESGFYFHPYAPDDIVIPSDIDTEEATAIFTSPDFIETIRGKLLTRFGNKMGYIIRNNTVNSMRRIQRSKLGGHLSSHGPVGKNILSEIADVKPIYFDSGLPSDLQLALSGKVEGWTRPNMERGLYVPANFSIEHIDHERLDAQLEVEANAFEERTGKTVDRQQLKIKFVQTLQTHINYVTRADMTFTDGCRNPFYRALGFVLKFPPHTKDVLNDYVIPAKIKEIFHFPIKT